MQEFKFHNQKIRGCFQDFIPKDLNQAPSYGLEGFFVWTSDGVYHCRPKVVTFFLVLFSFPSSNFFFCSWNLKPSFFAW